MTKPRRRPRGELYRELARTLGASLEGDFQPLESLRKMEVDEVVRDSMNNPVSFYANEGGQGRFNVQVLPGQEVNENDIVYVSHTKSKLAGPNLKFVGLASSSSAGQGTIRRGKGLVFPSPTFRTPATTSNLIINPGSIVSEVIVHIEGVEDKLSPSSYRVLYKLSSDPDWATAWSDVILHQNNNVELNLRLSRTFAPGTELDIRMSTVYSYLDSEVEADLSTTITIETATDDADPGAAEDIEVDVTTPGMLVAQASGTQVSGVHRGYRYEVSMAQGGPAIFTSPVMTGPLTFPAGAGEYFVAATPISINNVAGTRFPSTGFFPVTGPGYTVVSPVVVDLTPPATWGAPTIYDVSEIDSQGILQGRLEINLAPYTYPSDYSHTIIKIYDNNLGYETLLPIEYVAADPIDYFAVYTGTGDFLVYVMGVDKQGNKSVFSPASNNIVIARPSTPPTPGSITTSSIPSGIKISFTIPTGAKQVAIWRATSAGGAGATQIATTSATFYLDLFISASSAGTIYYYKIQGYNDDGAGPLNSTWTAGTVGSLDGSNIVALTITQTEIADNAISTPKLQALSIDAGKIQANAIIAGKIAANAVTATEIAAGSITAGKIAAGLIISDIFLTAASPASRIEIRGQTGVNSNQIRFHENVSSVDQLRGIMDGTGIYLYERISGVDIVRTQLVANGITVKGDGAQSDIKMYRHSGGRGRLESHGIVIGYDTKPFVSINTGTAAGELRFTGVTDVTLADGNHGSENVIVWTRASSFGDEPLISFTNQDLSPKLGVYKSKIGVYFTGTGETTWAANTAGWISSGYIRAGSSTPNGGVESYPFQMRQSTTLSNTVSTTLPLQAWQFATGNIFGLRLDAYRSIAASGDWQGARALLRSEVDNYGFTGGSLQLGARAYAPFWSLGRGTGSDVFWDDTNTRTETSNLRVNGSLVKTSGSFVIAHPDPKKNKTHELRHTFVEGPTSGENIYTYVIEFDGETATVWDSEGEKVDVKVHTSQQNTFSFRLPDYWRFLNKRPRTWTSIRARSSSWNQARAEVNAHETEMVVECEGPGKWNILLMGTRKDEDAINWWELRGVEKRLTQMWTKADILARRNSSLERRATMKEVSRASKKEGALKTKTLTSPFLLGKPNVDALIKYNPYGGS